MSLYGWNAYYQKYYIPYMEDVLRFTDEREESEYTYFDLQCGIRDLTQPTLEDVTITSVQDARSIQERHGITYYPQLLSPATSEEMRAYVLDKNENAPDEERIGLIAQRNRWSFYIGIQNKNDDDDTYKEDVIVETVLEELAQHELLYNSFKEIMKGQEPALVEFTAITSAYGADDQHWHVDTQPSDIHYNSAFVPMFSLFVPLQNTNEQMGPTDTCPGSHVCSDSDRLTDLCEEIGKVRIAPMKQGDGMLMHLQTWHRGPAHTDPTPNSERVMLILTFSPVSPTKQISLGTSYSLRWDMHSYLLKDFIQPSSPAITHRYIRNLQSLGIIPSSSNDDNDGRWTYLRVIASRIIHSQFAYRHENLMEWIDYIQESEQTNKLIKYLAGMLPKEETWIDYFRIVLQRTYTLLRDLYTTLMILTTLTSIMIYSISSSDNWKSLLRRPCYHFVWVGFFYLLLQRILDTQVDRLPVYKQKSQTFSKSYNPISTHLLPSSKLELTSMPTRDTILFPSRTDSLGFHRANHDLDTKLASANNNNEKGNHCFQMVTFWLTQIVTANQQRCLSQNLQTGDWHLVSPQEREKYIQWKWLIQNQFLPSWNEHSPMILKSSHSHLLVQDLLQILFPPKNNEKKKMKKQQSPLMRLNPAMARIPSLSKASTPLEEAYSALPSLDKQEKKDDMIWRAGDFVEQFVEGDEGWFRGQIVGFSYQRKGRQVQELIEILFDDGVFVDDNLPEELRPFKPYVQGEKVWITWPDNNEPDSVGIITHIKANLHFQIQNEQHPQEIYSDMPLDHIRRFS